MSAHQSKTSVELEGIIERGLTTFVEVGSALREIRVRDAHGAEPTAANVRAIVGTIKPEKGRWDPTVTISKLNSLLRDVIPNPVGDKEREQLASALEYWVDKLQGQRGRA